MDMRASLSAFMQQPCTLAELQSGNQAFAREEVQHFLASMQQMHTADEKNHALSDLAALIPNCDCFHAAMLALLCGILVEQGGAIAVPIDATLELMVKLFRHLQDYQRLSEQLSAEELFQRAPEAMRAQAGLPFLVPAVMAMLCRDVETRMQWQQRSDVIELIDALEEADAIPFYIKRVFSLLDNKDLLILDRFNIRGFLTRLVGIQDVMYHCYALLQSVILEQTGPGYLDAEPVDPKAVRYAQNRDLTQQDYSEAEDLYDEQRFGFSTPGGLIFFPGSASFSEVTTIDGMPVLLIEKKLMTFSWQPSNMYPVLHEALQARVEMVRELEREEVEAWLRRL